MKGHSATAKCHSGYGSDCEDTGRCRADSQVCGRAAASPSRIKNYAFPARCLTQSLQPPNGRRAWPDFASFPPAHGQLVNADLLTELRLRETQGPAQCRDVPRESAAAPFPLPLPGAGLAAACLPRCSQSCRHDHAARVWREARQTVFGHPPGKVSPGMHQVSSAWLFLPVYTLAYLDELPKSSISAQNRERILAAHNSLSFLDFHFWQPPNRPYIWRDVFSRVPALWQVNTRMATRRPRDSPSVGSAPQAQRCHTLSPDVTLFWAEPRPWP